MAISFDDIPASVYDSFIHEQFEQYALDDSHPGFYNFVCPNPECGDMNFPNKKKAYIYTDTWLYVCWKCGERMHFARWLKEHDEQAYQRLLFMAFGNDRGPKKDAPVPRPERKLDATLPFKDGELMSIYDSDPLAQAALALCRSRRIREEVYAEWFVCRQGEQFYDRDEAGNIKYDEYGRPKGNDYRNRIIIPFYKFGGKWGQFDARAIDPNNPLRYRNFTGVKRGAYNIDFINYSETIYILEGTIDSTFIRNSIAIGGIPHFGEVIAENPQLAANKDKIVVLWDNDPEGRKARAGTTCDQGYKWFSWEGIRSKDVNGAVMSGEFPVNSEGYVDENFLKSRTRDPEGASILFTMKYGNMKKEASRKRFDALKAFREGRANPNNRPEVLF